MSEFSDTFSHTVTEGMWLGKIKLLVGGGQLGECQLNLVWASGDGNFHTVGGRWGQTYTFLTLPFVTIPCLLVTFPFAWYFTKIFKRTY